MTAPAVRFVLDTNVFVAAGFNRRSSSARLIDAAREGLITAVWSRDTRAETEFILSKIPPLSLEIVRDVFKADGFYNGELDEDRFDVVEDPADRKFAALGEATGAAVVSSDSDLLDVARELLARVVVMTPGQATAWLDGTRVPSTGGELSAASPGAAPAPPNRPCPPAGGRP